MFKIISLLFFCILQVSALNIDKNTTNFDLLQESKIFLDKENKFKDIDKNKIIFTKNNKSNISLGFVLNQPLWIKIELKNNSNELIEKILEYKNSLTEKVIFYVDNKVFNDGMFNAYKRGKIYPNIKLTFKPYEKKTIYIKASCETSGLMAKVLLWNEKDFIKKDFIYQLIVSMLLFSIVILLIYNAFIFVFTKDITYIYYILYLFTILILQTHFNGLAQIYFYSKTSTIVLTNIMVVNIALMAFFITMFTRVFLQMKQFPKIDALLKYYSFFVVISSFFAVYNWFFNLTIIVFYLPLALVVVFSGFYALSKGVKQAKFYVIGWSLVLIVLFYINLKSAGIIDYHFEFINEIAYVLEALLFSIALAHRIKIVNEEKEVAKQDLINYQKQEHEKLEILVKEKTIDLRKSLEEKNLLYKELNHRVKNNLQMIISLIKLQISNTNVKDVEKELLITKNRISSIANLYELFLNENTIITANEYFKLIVNTLKEGWSKDIKVFLDIEKKLKSNNLIYCGMILNELLNNTYKYAYKEKGDVNIEFYKKNNRFYLKYSDYGVGLKKDYKASLGLIIIDTLVSKQLLGEYTLSSKDGIYLNINWSENEGF